MILYIINLFFLLYIIFLSNLSNNHSPIHTIDKCYNLTSHTPRNVHNLHINNIDVVIGMGDSITAGFGIKGTIGLYHEYRGRSWSMGGDKGQLTLPNLIRYYNPNIRGYSIGSHKLEVCYDTKCNTEYYPKLDNYNSAQSGSTTNNLIHQIEYLKKRVNVSDKIDKWKLITLLIGANDLCGICSNNDFQPELFRKNLREALFELKNNFPKSFVNMVLIFKVTDAYILSRDTFYCRALHTIFPVECPCVFNLMNGKKDRHIIDYYTFIYQNITRDVVYEVNTKDPSGNFTITIQPMFSMANISDFTIDFLSTLDCFYPSLEAHQSMAISLWNNLFLHPLKKETFIQYPDLKCPQNNSILYSNYETS